MNRNEAGLLADAVASFKELDYAAAERSLNVVLNNDRRNPDALHLLGLIRFQQRKLEEARQLIEGAINANPNISFYYNNLALVLPDLKDFSSALMTASSAAVRAPQDPEPLVTKGSILHRLTRFDETVEVYQSAIKLNPDHHQAHLNLGLAFLETGKATEAENHFRIAMELVPHSPDAILGLGNTFLQMGRIDDAISHFSHALADGAEHKNLYLLLAHSHLRANDPEVALSTLKEAQARYPDDALIWNDIGYALRDLTRLDEATSAFERALELNPALDSAADNLAQVLLAQGNFGRAWPLYSRRKSKQAARSIFEDVSFDEWLRSDGPNQDLRVWTEQGLGDEVLQASLIPELRTKVRSLSVFCSQRLLHLFKTSFSGVDIFPHEDLREDESSSQESYQIPLIDAAAALRSTIEDFPTKTSYLAVPKEMTQGIRNRYLQVADNPAQTPYLIGISWQSSHAVHGTQNSIPLDQWNAIFDGAAHLKRPVIFVALQHGVSKLEVEATAQSLEKPILYDQSIDQAGDMVIWWPDRSRRWIWSFRPAPRRLNWPGRWVSRFGLCRPLDLPVDGIGWHTETARLGTQACEFSDAAGMSHLIGRSPKWLML